MSDDDRIEHMREAAREFGWLWRNYGSQLESTIILGGWVGARGTGDRNISSKTSDAISLAAVDALVKRMREWAEEK